MSIRFKLNDVAEEERISIKRLARDSRVDYKTLHWLKTGKQLGISFSVLERICRALQREPGDLFELVEKRRSAEGRKRLVRNKRSPKRTKLG
jgi:putative transcriptional regulator